MRLSGLRAGVGLTLAAALVTAAAAAPAQPSSSTLEATKAAQATGCTQRTATPAYTAAVARAVASKQDVWGEELLRRRGGPSYEAARRYLTPLLFAQQRKKRPLTPSGVYYLPFSYPLNVSGPAVFGLHVADGGQIITRRVGGPSLTVRVGSYGLEQYGSCLSRLTPAKLAEGYLPILQTGYVDANGVRYRQESFAARVDGSPTIVSFLRLDVDAGSSRAATTVRLVPSQARLALRGERLVSGAGVRLVVSEGATYDGKAFRFRIAPGQTSTVYAVWLHRPSRGKEIVADEAHYDAARANVARFWETRLAAAATFSVPEERIVQAQRAMLVQQIGHTWRYSAGNPYEALSFAEGLDTAEVMASYGFDDVARAILRFSLQRLPYRYTAWRTGEQLVATATYYRLFHDRVLVHESAPTLGRLLGRLEGAQIRSGPKKGRLTPEQLSSDIPDRVDNVTSQLLVWQGLRSMQPVWRATGHHKLAGRAARIGDRLEVAMRKATRAATRRLPDGSLFLPESLSGPVVPYDKLSASNQGSYWNLVVPYAFASGFFPAGGRQADGYIQYLLRHGSRMLGVPRADAHIIYGKDALGHNIPGTAGLGQIYGLSVSRFLADNDRPDQLVLSLYGLLGIGMTPDTYVSGEAVSVVPLGDAYYRKTYMPPNIGANSTFLETLRLMLVHERRNGEGVPTGLDLAFATPRRWLADGQTIDVQRAPTSFGLISYTLEREAHQVVATLTIPSGVHSLRLRLRLPEGERVAAVHLGGRPVPFPRSTGTIDLSGRHGQLQLVARVADTRSTAGGS